ncbi:OLC1v1021945C1 [Oldenlandia corymbosa var. corymbosa]|uniref:OLC1v1021945C1 n=1 Tax=Oldenlandia corymbosa var. corymbosa TaxID=529605 RepID=A0AAV1BWS2_OLDCO|nr:OLC1v1021945C1 [Oldenlandia corymbosa var. corymbosa]
MGLLASSLFVLLNFLIISSSTVASQKTNSFRPKAIVLPITKDSSSGQYITQISQRTPLIPVKLTIDLGGQTLWVNCDEGYVSSSYKPAICGTPQCSWGSDSKSRSKSQACSERLCFLSPGPGCNNYTCGTFPYNSITHSSTIGELFTDVLSVQSTDGSNPGRKVTTKQVVSTCGSSFLVEGLANGVKGIAGLGRGWIGFPTQLAIAFRFSRKFAVCLGSTGVIFFGDSPYNFLQGKNVTNSLSYTPLLINPVSTAGAHYLGDSSDEYFVGLKSILVSGKPVSINSTLLAIKKGHGGTKISTVVPYTVMESTIHRSFTKAFAKAFSGVPRVKSVAPFGLCYNSSNLGTTRVGPPAPVIDFVFQNSDVAWRIFGFNSMVSVKKDVLCLGFVDGGVDPETSIVIGQHQIVDNLLEFDLGRSRLGFSSTLLLPFDSLIRFRCVSKSWRALIDSPFFTKTHSKRSLQYINLNSDSKIVVSQGTRFHAFDSVCKLGDGSGSFRAVTGELNKPPSKFRRYRLKFVGSCNGIICLQNQKKGYLSLWNPWIQEHSEVPSPPFEHLKGVAFGYDHINDDFKVVRWTTSYDDFDSRYELCVYSLQLKSWKKTKGSIPLHLPEGEYYYGCLPENYAFLNGALHWFLRERGPFNNHLIVAFDLGTEEFRKIYCGQFPTKPYLRGCFLERKLVVLNGRLSLFRCFNAVVLGGQYYGLVGDIYLMEDYDGSSIDEQSCSWTKLTTIEFPSNLRADYRCNYRFTPVAFSKKMGKILLQVDYVKLVVYDIEDKSFRDVDIGGEASCFTSCTCVGSFCWPL